MATYLSYRFTASEAEDITQETLLVLVRRYRHIEDESELRQIATGIARKKCLEYYRDKYYRQRSLDSDELPENLPFDVDSSFIRKELAEKLNNFLWSSNEKSKQVLRLIVADKTPQEIAKLLDIKVQQVYLEKSRGLHKLKSQFFPDDDLKIPERKIYRRAVNPRSAGVDGRPFEADPIPMGKIWAKLSKR